MRFVIFALVAALTLGGPSARAEIKQVGLDLVAAVDGLFAEELDLLELKLRVDKIADPSTDAAWTRSEVEKLKSSLRGMVDPLSTPHERLKMLKRFYYMPGPWNDHRPFSYDLSDPLGKNFKHRLLQDYVTNRRGNCVSMPLLFVILGRSIGLDMTLAVAPQHSFVKFTDDEGRDWNLETTSGAGYTRESHYRSEMPMTDMAIKNGLYLRPLRGKQLAAMVADVIITQLVAEHRHEEVVGVADVLLKYDDRQVYPLVARASAFGMILRRDVIDRYPDLSALPPDVKDYADRLFGVNRLYMSDVEALGWRPEDGTKEAQQASGN